MSRTHGWLVRLLPIGFLCVFFTLALAAWSLRGLAERSRENQRALVALCALQNDLERRIDASKNFLEQHPAGVAGIPAAVIRTSIGFEQTTLDAIKPVLRCETI